MCGRLHKQISYRGSYYGVHRKKSLYMIFVCATFRTFYCSSIEGQLRKRISGARETAFLHNFHSLLNCGCIPNMHLRFEYATKQNDKPPSLAKLWPLSSDSPHFFVC